MASFLFIMHDIQKHKEAFDKILDKYDLRSEEKADEIANFLTSHSDSLVSLDEFARLFAMSKEEAHIFLSFVARGLKFKEEHLDKK